MALDYRVRLDPATERIPGVQVKVTESRRSIEARVAPGVDVLVQGREGERFLRFDDDGVWAFAGSPTAQEAGLVDAGDSGWTRVAEGRTLVWHEDRRLAPSSDAPDRFSIPIVVGGRTAAIEGNFVAVSRPSVVPWIIGGVALAVGIGIAATRRRLQAALVLVLGLVGGTAALVAMTAFTLRASQTGGLEVFPFIATLVVGGVLGALLIALRGTARAGVAGVVGAFAVAVAIAFLPVFWRGVVVSAAPETLVRVACLLALVCGAAAACLGFFAAVEELEDDELVHVPEAR